MTYLFWPFSHTDFQIGMKDRSFLDLDIEGTNDPKHECKWMKTSKLKPLQIELFCEFASSGFWSSLWASGCLAPWCPWNLPCVEGLTAKTPSCFKSMKLESCVILFHVYRQTANDYLDVSLLSLSDKKAVRYAKNWWFSWSRLPEMIGKISHCQTQLSTSCMNSITHRIHGAGIYANMTGVYWWDPCYHI